MCRGLTMGAVARAIAVAVVVLVALGVSPRLARADESVREVIEGVQELAAPADRTDLRFELGAVATVPRFGGKATVAIEIAPRPDYWYGIGAAGISETTVTTVQIIKDGMTTSEIRTSTSDSVALSVRVFKRIGIAVLSAGLIENRGGVAAELRGFDDRLRLELMVAEWSPWQATAVPNLRLGGSVQWRMLVLQAGAQDLLDRSLASVYLGAGIRWRDPDLKAALFWIARL